MRFAQFRLPLSIAAGLLTTASFAVEPGIPSQFDSDIYSSFAQADGVPPVPEMPRSGVPNEDVYQYRAAAPQEAAVEEGATLCFDYGFEDLIDTDSIYLNTSGQIFDPNFVNPAATVSPNPAAGIPTVNSNF